MISKEQIRKALDDGIIDGDGHTIVAPEYYTDAGFDCRHLEVEYKSSAGSYKETIYKDGEVVNTCKGIHTLKFLRWVAGEAGLTDKDYGSYLGRGTQARFITSALEKWANSPDNDGLAYVDDDGELS